MTQYPIHEHTLSRGTFAFPFVTHTTITTWIKPHYHQFYEISLYAQGNAADLVNGQTFNTSRGSLVYKPPYSIHETRLVSGQPYTKHNLMFDLDILLEADNDSGLRQFFSFHPERERSPFCQLAGERLVLLERLFHEISIDYKEENPFKTSYIRSKLIEILVQIARSHGQVGMHPAVDDPRDQGRGSTIMSRVLQHINNHYLTEMSLSDLSRMFDVSTPYLSKMIKKMTNMTFTDYLHALRMEMACSLLVSTRMSILDIAVESGYSSFKTFSRVFLQKKGMSPSKYRRQFTKVK